MSGFMADFDADLARPFGVAAVSGSSTSTSGWNPSDIASGGVIRGSVFSNSLTNTTIVGVRGTKSYAAGRVYFECMVLANFNDSALGSGSYESRIGFANSKASLTSHLGSDANGFSINELGRLTYNGSTLKTLSTAGAGDVYGFACDIGAGVCYFAQNNAWQGGGTPGNGATSYTAPTGPLFIAATGLAYGDGGLLITNPLMMAFGPPAGFQAWG